MNGIRIVGMTLVAALAISGCVAGPSQGEEAAAAIDTRPFEALREDIARSATDVAEDPAAAHVTMLSTAARLRSFEEEARASYEEGRIDAAQLAAFESEAELLWGELDVLEGEIVAATGGEGDIQLRQAKGGTVTIGDGSCGCYCQCETARTRCIVGVVFDSGKTLDDCEREKAVCDARCIVKTIFGTGTIIN